MKSLFPHTPQQPASFNIVNHHSEDHVCAEPAVYEFQEHEDLNTSKRRGYRKPKQLWMAKDQSMSLVSSNPELTQNSSGPCSEVPGPEGLHMQTDSAYATQQMAELTPLRNGYHGISPSTSSSAPNTVALPSSLTTTSSSPSNHPSPQNRSATNAYGVSQYESPEVSDQPSNQSHSSVLSVSQKLKPKRGRPPKPKTDSVTPQKTPARRKRQPKPKPASVEPPPPVMDASPFQFGGGLKMRFRRDLSVEDPLVGKKSRKRKSNQNSGPVFRIVEAWCDADAPGGHAVKTSAPSPSSSSLVSGSFRIGDVVWAKIAGYPYWPSRISALWDLTPQQLAQVNPENEKSVAATPADPSLAHGFTAKVEWFAWNQVSFLSCAKLFSFQKHFEKLHNPRTRVKGYNEAVEMAKNIISGETHSPTIPSAQCPDIVPAPQTDFFSVPQEIEQKRPDGSCPLDLSLGLLAPANSSLSSNVPPFSQSDGDQFSLLNSNLNPADFLQGSSLVDPGWAPLPQLDVSGLNDINSGVPTFSEDEDDENESFANQLKSTLGSIGP